MEVERKETVRESELCRRGSGSCPSIALYCQNVRSERYVRETFVGIYALLRVALSGHTAPH